LEGLTHGRNASAFSHASDVGNMQSAFSPWTLQAVMAKQERAVVRRQWGR